MLPNIKIIILTEVTASIKKQIYTIMKHVLFYSIISIVLLFASCNQEDLTEVNSTESKFTVENGILNFKDGASFDETLAMVSKFNDEERANWEKSIGFNSFGAECDNFYNSLDFENAESIDEIIELDVNNKYLNYYTEKGEVYLEPKELSSSERFLCNSDKLYIVENNAFKLLSSELVSTNIENISDLKKISNIKLAKESSLFAVGGNRFNDITRASIQKETLKSTESNSNYKIKVIIQTEIFHATFPTRTDRETEFTIKNYKKRLGVWTSKKLETDYDVDLISYDENSGIYNYCREAKNNQTFAHYNLDTRYTIWPGSWTWEFVPYFADYYAYARNEKGCEVTIEP